MAITTQDMLNLKQRLKVAWKDIMPDAASVGVWRDSFRDYNYDTVEKAIIDYMSANKYKPNPADIINCIPAAKADQTKPVKIFVPKYETLPDGRVVRVIKCRKCNDTGLITWMDDDFNRIGRICTCEAAIANYGIALRSEDR